MKLRILFYFIIVLIHINVIAGDNINNSPHEFEIIKKVDVTSVKNQGRTGTCWAFATTSFIESELLRMGKGEFDLSEMYFVRACYVPKAKRFVRYHGKSNFSEGGQAHDVMSAIKINGIVPESVFNGMTFKQGYHNHGEMTSILYAMLDALIKKNRLTTKWLEAYSSILDVYLGSQIEKFDFDGIEYSPTHFKDELEFNPEDYIEFTSYTHHPFYELVNLELPDNWSGSLYYNVPIDDLILILNHSINNGYSIVWDGDSGKDHFKRKEGYAVIPSDDWNDQSEGPETEKVITQLMRQVAFDNYDITDDHLMHIVGLAKNQNDTQFYYTKNSWGTEDKGFDGFYYMSEEYVKLKTVAIMVHKDAVPKEIMIKFN